jgi:hypothetical protein
MFLSEPRQGPVTFADPIGEPLEISLASLGDDLVRLQRVTGAAYRQQSLVDNTFARQEAIEQAIDRRIAAVRRATGVTLENYMRARPTLYEQLDRNRPPAETLTDAPETPRDAFHRTLRELQESFPDRAHEIRAEVEIEDDARAAAKNAEAELQQLMADPKLGPITGFLAALTGGIGASFRDPLQVSLLWAGGGAGTGGVAARVGQVALREAAINAGGVALMQPNVQAWRAEAGLRNGVMPALENIGMAALLGGVFGSGIQGVREWTGRGKAAAEKVMAGRAAPADVEDLARQPGIRLTESENGVLRQAGRAEAAERTSESLPGVAGPSSDEVLVQAIRHAEDPLRNPPPEIALPLPARRPAIDRLVEESRSVELGSVETIDGKPVSFERFDPRALSTDAATFQYKGGGDAEGVTERLRYVTQWDATASGKAFVWERNDGHQFVADGHQRLGLARRLIDEGQDGIAIDGFRFREADGWTASDVRALAAKKNLQEGSGDALDAARILRERPDILDGKLPVSGPMMKNAIALSRLSDEAFGAALNGIVPMNHAAAIGAMVPDPKKHAAILADLVRFAPETEREARILIGEAMAAGFRTEQQINLFGAADLTRSLMGERVRILDRALADLSQNKKLFGTLSQKADTIEAANNSLDRFGNQWKASQAARLGDLLVRLAQRTGPISDALNRAAARMADGQKVGAVSKEFLDTVETMLSRDGLDGLLAEPKLAPAQVVEPASKEAAQIAEIASAERQGRAEIEPHGALAPEDGVAKSPKSFLDDGELLGEKHRGAVILPDGRLIEMSSDYGRVKKWAGKGVHARYAAEVGGDGYLEITAYGSRSISVSPRGDLMLTPQQQRTIAALQAEARRRPNTNLMLELPEDKPPQPSLGEFIAGQRGASLDQLHARATALQGQLAEAGRAIEAETGARFVDPGVKKAENAAAKIARKGYDDASQMTDLARSAFRVDDAETADRVAARLADNFGVLDEGWKTLQSGYTDRKLLIRSADGTIGEVQIVPEAMWKARKDGGGHQLYVQARALSEGPEQQALEARMRAIYSAASAEMETSFGSALKSSGPNSPSNLARQSASDINPAVWKTSNSSTLDQGAPGLSTAKADRGLSNSTAGRQSQSQNFMGKSSNQNIDPGGAGDKEYSLFEQGSREVETLTLAATRFGGKVYTGPNHVVLMERVAAENGIDPKSLVMRDDKENLITLDGDVVDPATNPKIIEDGFVTSRGRFVDRREALQIAKAQNQLHPDAGGHAPDHWGLDTDDLAPIPGNNWSGRFVEEAKGPSLFEQLAVGSREDGRDMKLVSREAALADAERGEFHADLFASCKD